MRNVGRLLIQHHALLEPVLPIHQEHVIVVIPFHNHIHVLLVHSQVHLVSRLHQQVGNVIQDIHYMELPVGGIRTSNTILVQMEETLLVEHVNFPILLHAPIVAHEEVCWLEQHAG